MIKFFKTDSFWLGGLLGILIPAAMYGLLHFGNNALGLQSSGKLLMRESTVQVLSIALNVILMRYFLIRKRFDKAGRGVLFVTFIYAIIFLVLYLD